MTSVRTLILGSLSLFSVTPMQPWVLLSVSMFHPMVLPSATLTPFSLLPSSGTATCSSLPLSTNITPVPLTPILLPSPKVNVLIMLRSHSQSLRGTLNPVFFPSFFPSSRRTTDPLQCPLILLCLNAQPHYAHTALLPVTDRNFLILPLPPTLTLSVMILRSIRPPISFPYAMM